MGWEEVGRGLRGHCCQTGWQAGKQAGRKAGSSRAPYWSWALPLCSTLFVLRCPCPPFAILLSNLPARLLKPDLPPPHNPHPIHYKQGKQFSVIVTEGRPDETGLTMARVLEEMRVPTTVVLDSAVGYVMER